MWLLAALALPGRHLREAVFSLIQTLQIRGIDLYRFARTQLEEAYTRIAEYEAVLNLEENPCRNLLLDHLEHQGAIPATDDESFGLYVLRVMAITDHTGQLEIIRQGLTSTDRRQRANSQEALNDLIDRRLALILLPLLDASSRRAQRTKQS